MPGDGFLGAIFVLRLANGDLAYRETDFKLTNSSDVNPVNSTIDAPKRDIKFSVFGATDVFAQFFVSQKPVFIRDELIRWSTEQTRTDYAEYRVRRLVELTIQHTTRRDTVGGHVNSVELTESGIHWLTDNPECSPEYK